MVINSLKYSAQLIAPNPKEIDYWIDLSEDTNGGIIKYYNGTKWDYLNQMDDQNAQIDDIKETLANIKINKVNDTQYQLIVDNKVVGTIDIPESKTYTFTNGTDGSFTVADGSNSQKVTIGKPATAGTADIANSVAWDNVSGKPSTYTPSTHTHTVSQITDFPELSTVATSGSYADLTGKPTNATTSTAGLMSSTDKKNLDNLVSNTAGYQTEAQVNAKVSALVNSAPETLDTLDELAAALGDDPNFATTITNQIGTKADKTVVSTSANGLMSSTDKQKLDSIEENANNYILPTASASTKGGVKQATSVADTTIDGTETATTVATTLNSLLAALRTAGILAS